MFIKRDRRKINQILKEGGEDGEKLTTLKLSKRAAEFQGNTRVLFQEPKVDMLLNLRVLNLYDNELSSVPNIGMLSRTPLEKINLGCNKLRELPLDFGTIATLRTVWLDDNEFTVFPTCVCQIKGLQSLRISGNRITHIPALISSLEYLETLVSKLHLFMTFNMFQPNGMKLRYAKSVQAADNNELTEFPSGCRLLSRLKNLWLR